MFAIRGEIIFRYIQSDLLTRIHDRFNDEKSFDANWFGIMSRTYEDAERVRWQTAFKTLPGSSLSRHHELGFLADAQYEHAWERILTYLVILSGLESHAFSTRTFTSRVIKRDVSSLLYKQRNIPVVYNGLHNESLCNGSRLMPNCLQKAVSGECLLRPHSMDVNCRVECGCMHSTIKLASQLRKQMGYFSRTLVRHQSNGPFSSFNQFAVLVDACLHSAEAINLLSYSKSPVVIKSVWQLQPCSRILGYNGSQLFLAADGSLVHTYGTHIQTLSSLSNKPMTSHRFRYIQVTKNQNSCEISRTDGHHTLNKQILLVWMCPGENVRLDITSKGIVNLLAGAEVRTAFLRT